MNAIKLQVLKFMQISGLKVPAKLRLTREFISLRNVEAPNFGRWWYLNVETRENCCIFISPYFELICKLYIISLSLKICQGLKLTLRLILSKFLDFHV